MRPQSKIQYSIHGKLVGGPRPLVCVPLMASSQEGLLAQATAVSPLKPDLIEWRVDAFEALPDVEAVRRALAALIANRCSRPLLFTCRAKDEGGLHPLAADDRLKVYRMAITSGLVDLVDIELASGAAMIQPLIKAARAADVKLILSYHDFDRTPEVDVLLETFRAAAQAGADIAKIAVMPKDSQDVLTLLRAACAARQRYLDIPLVAISMGAEGVVSRIVGGQFGSDITFANGGIASAPGQIAIQDLRQAWAVLPWTQIPDE